jgi:sodium-coupled neutral amino acid transporter 10
MNGSPGGIIYFGNYSGFFLALPIFIFSYSSQSSFYPIYNNLIKQGGTILHMRSVVNSSIVITAFLYITCGGLGVIGYPKNTQGNIMLNLPRGAAVDVLLISMSISIILSFPVIIWPMRESVDQLYLLMKRSCLQEDYKDSKETFFFSFCDSAYIHFVIETLILIGITVLISIPSFATILG